MAARIAGFATVTSTHAGDVPEDGGRLTRIGPGARSWASPSTQACTTDAVLKRATEEAATATVLVVHPTASDATELALPGARAFTDAPI